MQNQAQDIIDAQTALAANPQDLSLRAAVQETSRQFTIDIENRNKIKPKTDREVQELILDETRMTNQLLRELIVSYSVPIRDPAHRIIDFSGQNQSIHQSDCHRL
jgi:hypothetical protein